MKATVALLLLLLLLLTTVPVTAGTLEVHLGSHHFDGNPKTEQTYGVGVILFDHASLRFYRNSSGGRTVFAGYVAKAKIKKAEVGMHFGMSNYEDEGLKPAGSPYVRYGMLTVHVPMFMAVAASLTYDW